MADRDYRHRDIVDKLGIKPGQLVALAEEAGAFDGDLRRRVLARSGRALAVGGEQEVDVVLVAADASTDAVATLNRWKRRLEPSGGIWLLTPKRGRATWTSGS